ncbi:MAG: hypothetical protein F6K63_13555 [Moorea sp. SIO1G6]|uniref:hypothetical protein n=1 Tax=Moorena sp. SIO1G6 TaxID=2607840 RepID=UPI0013BFBFFC|nr:hypothetical protein [Moorena sp. SIO1G6]NET65347.1 hypothetical protein [Moorena sp. SIO1G6]
MVSVVSVVNVVSVGWRRGKCGECGGRGKLYEQLAPQDGATFQLRSHLKQRLALPVSVAHNLSSLFPDPLFPKSRARGKRQELIKYSAASLLPVPRSAVPCSLKSKNFVPNPIENCLVQDTVC